jgi:hypothetical protein
MGGGQAGAQADDDHASWSHSPPGVATVTLPVTVQIRPGWASPDPGTGAGLGPDPGLFEKSAGALGAHGARWDPFVNARALADLAKLSNDSLSARAAHTMRARWT